MHDILSVLITVAGGLGVFLLGMKHLSDGLQAVGGQGLRKFMGLATTHRLAGVGTGVVSTLIVQSSSIITVMLVGFVSSGMLTLQQAINVIIGANIGTTGTVWIVAFAPSPQILGLVGITIGGALYFFMRGDRLRNWGLAVLGLGLVFLGLYFMSEGVMPIRENPNVAGCFKAMDATTYGGIVLVALAATAFTAVIQSSAATIAIAITLATQGLITYEVAISVLFGANIGTTMTAWLAAIGGSAEARRTALAHTMSNVIGTIVFIPFVPLLVKGGHCLFPNLDVAETVMVGGKPMQMFTHMAAPIAITDTVFSVLRGVLLFPFVKRYARFISWMIPQKGKEKPHLSALKAGPRLSPVIACDQALLEVQFMRDTDLELLGIVRKVIDGTAEDSDEDYISHREDILDDVQRDVTEFLGTVMAKRLPIDVAERARRLLRLTDELESVSDEASTIVKVTRRLRRNGQTISDVSREVLLSVHDRVVAFAAEVSPWVKSPRPAIDVGKVHAESTEIHEFVRECRRTQLGRVGQDDPSSPMRVLVELDVINAYERIRAYYLNVAEALVGGKFR